MSLNNLCMTVSISTINQILTQTKNWITDYGCLLYSLSTFSCINLINVKSKISINKKILYINTIIAYIHKFEEIKTKFPQVQK